MIKKKKFNNYFFLISNTYPQSIEIMKNKYCNYLAVITVPSYNSFQLPYDVLHNIAYVILFLFTLYMYTVVIMENTALLNFFIML